MSAFACGNNVILKPSEHTPATSNLVKSIISAVFPANVFSVIEGDAEVASELLKLKWDYIFFTGSVKIGKIVAKAAAINLTPTTLELGGKSPAIIDDSLDMKLVSKRIVWGKFLNSGQTCVAPDYLIVHESIKDLLIKELINSILEAFGKFTDKINNYTSIVNENNFDRLVKLINESKVIFGGQHDRKTKFIYPTLVDTPNAEDNIMIDEIFGPILPILTFNCQDDIDEIINKNPNPLALYVFTKSKEFEEKIINRYKFGGGAVNDTIVHLANPKLPFGGIGNSGYGSYHGKYSFELFTHNKSIVKRATWYDNKLRYAPYAKKFSLMKKIIKYFG
jgi:aldehyde dehydrogenase (NAD+)